MLSPVVSVYSNVCATHFRSILSATLFNLMILPMKPGNITLFSTVKFESMDKTCSDAIVLLPSDVVFVFISGLFQFTSSNVFNLRPPKNTLYIT